MKLVLNETGLETVRLPVTGSVTGHPEWLLVNVGAPGPDQAGPDPAQDRIRGGGGWGGEDGAGERGIGVRGIGGFAFID